MTTPYEEWGSIRESGTGDGRLEIPSKTTPVNTGYGQVRYGIGPAGEPRLMVPCAKGLTRITIPPTEKLFVTVISLTGPDGRQSYIDLICRDMALEKVFSELCTEVIRRLEDGESPEKGVTQAIEDFRALLARPSTAEVSREKILGLVGELYMLCKMTSLGIESPPLWLGPWEQRHDFRGNSLALEVKSSGRSDTNKVYIHGIDQLSPPEGGRLVLTHLRFEEEASGPISVSSLYHHLRNEIADVLRLNNGLSLVGCDDPDASEWNSYRFSLQSLGAWEIVDGFPRITASEFLSGHLPPGIENLEYTVDLTAATEFEIEDADMDKYIKEMANA